MERLEVAVMDMDLEALAVMDMLIEAELLRVIERLPGNSMWTFTQTDLVAKPWGFARSECTEHTNS
jgi:hypothetical protein